MKITVSVLAIVLFCSGTAFAKEAKHPGKYYFNHMKGAIMEVVEGNQGLINKGKDLPALKPKAIYKKTYNMFKKIIGADFSIGKFNKSKDPAQIAKVVSTMLQAGRVTIAKSQKQINAEPDGSVKLKRFIPAVFGFKVATAFKAKTGVVLKQTTLGKGGYGARNKGNAPDSWEKASLKKVSAPGWTLNKSVTENVGSTFRSLKPIYIKKACLTCHGVPKGSNGPYGNKKEGYKVGDIRGGISVLINM